ncbi:MAG: PepSY domain-containing protein [Methylophilaceae bacterium]
MIRLSMGASLLALALTSNIATAGHGSFKPKAYDSLGKCLAGALKAHDGKVVKLEYKTERKVAVYEFDIEMADGKAWEVECSVKNSILLEFEEEVKADDPRFVALAKVSEEDAKATALAAHPGKVIEVEYELESDGKASYEIDVLEADNEEIKVEIDATTGKIVEVGYESYQIGKE